MLENNRSTPGLTMLVVEDEHLFREMLCEAITLLEPTWRIYEAVNGQAGIEQAQSKRPDLILVDFHMPFMTGYQMALALKQKPETAQIPLILSTSEHPGHPEVMLMRSMCMATLFKPFSLHELAQVLEQIKLVIAPLAFQSYTSRDMGILAPELA